MLKEKKSNVMEVGDISSPEMHFPKNA